MTRLLILCSLFVLKSVDSFDVKECKHIGDAAAELEEKINVTLRFLRTPEEYIPVATKCQELFDCAKAAEKDDREKFLEDYAACHFYIYYSSKFSDCVNKLLSKKDDKIPCLNTLFNDIYEPDVDECPQWDGLQPCIKESIGKFCNDPEGKIQKEWEKQALILRPSICSEEKD